MNEAVANVLYEAERKGVKQIRGAFGEAGGRCAVGVLVEAAGIDAERLDCYVPLPQFGFPNTNIKLGLTCPLCGTPVIHEFGAVVHLNDDHRLTFSEIARKLGPDAA